MTALGLVVTLTVTMVLSGVLLSYQANAGAITTISDTLTVSAPSSVSAHTVVFTPATAGGASNHILITFTGFTGQSGITSSDVTIAGFTVSSVSYSGDTLKIEVLEALTATAKTVVLNGTNKLTNPSTTGSKLIEVNTTTSADAALDYGATYVAIVNGVTLNAVVAPSFTFVIDGMTTSEAIDGQTVASQSEDTYVGFGTLTAGTPVMMGSSLSVQSNATNGFVVTVQQNHNMLASSGADIDAFKDGVVQYPAALWSTPVGTIGNELTYGHLGITTEDDSTITKTASVTSTSDGHWIGLATGTPRTIWSYGGAADGVTQDIGHIDVGYRVQITALQEAGRYQSRLMYIATPTF